MDEGSGCVNNNTSDNDADNGNCASRKRMLNSDDEEELTSLHIDLSSNDNSENNNDNDDTSSRCDDIDLLQQTANSGTSRAAACATDKEAADSASRALPVLRVIHDMSDSDEDEQGNPPSKSVSHKKSFSNKTVTSPKAAHSTASKDAVAVAQCTENSVAHSGPSFEAPAEGGYKFAASYSGSSCPSSVSTDSPSRNDKKRKRSDAIDSEDGHGESCSICSLSFYELYLLFLKVNTNY